VSSLEYINTTTFGLDYSKAVTWKTDLVCALFDLMRPRLMNGVYPGKSWKMRFLSPGKSWNLFFACPAKLF